MGIATINAALAIFSITNERNCNFVAFVFFAIGTICCICIGSNISKMFLKYYSKEVENENTAKAKEEFNANAEIEYYNRTIRLLEYMAFIFPSCGLLAFIGPLEAADSATFAFFSSGLFLIALHELINMNKKTKFKCIMSVSYTHLTLPTKA